MSTDLLNKLRMQKKFRNLKAIQKLLENATQLEEYLTGQGQTLPSLNDNIDALPSDGFIHVDRDLHYLFETDPIRNSTRVTEIRSGDIKLTTTIEDNFFYQHMFNFALVVILLLQVIVVWAFIWCRLSNYANREMNTPPLEDGIALNDIHQLPEVIPQQHHNGEDRLLIEAGDGNVVAVANRCGRFG
ncbi:unnamed protein product [Orchesella dallaii]|uniref:Uncharacterized protein n=1 Tax=Orchesella dallaii TaxID=48710 RepID=A0ABP1S3M4_9HEXA